LSLSSFDSSVRGTRNLINFAHDCIHVSRLKFIFTSSIASALSWGSLQGPYPEETIFDARFAIGNGYGESKYVSERVFLSFLCNCVYLVHRRLPLAPCYIWHRRMLPEDRAGYRWVSKWLLGYHRLGTDLGKIEFGFGCAAIGEWGD